jgi:branched-chain amino acid transport system substrate-binding protein
MTGCSQTLSSTKGPVRIGQATALTSEYTTVGQYLLNGAKMAVDEINAAGGIAGRPIELIREDSANNNSAAVNAITKLIEVDHVVAILGPDLSTQGFAVAPIINKAKMPFLVEGSNIKLLENNPWFFRLRPSDAISAKAAAKFAVLRLKKTKIGITHDTNEYGTGGRDNVTEALKALGAEVVAVEAYNSNDRDLSAQLFNVQKKGAEVIIDWGLLSTAPTLERQKSQLNIKLPLIGPSAYAMPSNFQLAGDTANGTYVVTDRIPTQVKDPKVVAWCKKYRELFNSEPDFHASADYDGVYLLKAAIEKAGSTDSEAIRKALLTIENFEGISTIFTFKDGNGVHEVVTAQIKNGVPEVLENIKVE